MSNVAGVVTNGAGRYGSGPARVSCGGKLANRAVWNQKSVSSAGTR